MQNSYFYQDNSGSFLVEKIRSYFPDNCAETSPELLAVNFWFQSTRNAGAIAKVLETEISQRADINAPPVTVLLDALNRYFELINLGKSSLDGVFTGDEIMMLLNANPSGLGWDSRVITMFTMCYSLDEWDYSDFFDEERYSSLPEDMQEMVVLVRKLLGLNRLQNAALLDSLETWWRNPTGGVKEIGNVFAGLGFELIET